MEPVLLGLQALFLVLLYVFIWRVVRSASRDLRVPQESFIMAPAQARAEPVREVARQIPVGLVVLRSPVLSAGERYDTGAVPITIGRADDNTLALDGDEYASGHHARVETHRDGVWVHDLGSTNGTLVNGERINGRTRLREGDTLQIGETEMRLER
ncbi:MAG TPA: FHA domain-containing protein [Gaiellaceae bacterium]|nr:FHA domain-containing protein [Gaiellaceae bacterium]